MTQVQSLASGPTVAQKFGTWGVVPSGGIASSPAPHRSFTLLMSDEGKGKSFLSSDIPGALVFNFDLTGYATQRRAQVIPVLNSEGLTQGLTGERFIWSRERVIKLVAQLVEASAKNLPRPTTIVMDSLNAMMRVYLNHYGDNIKLTDYAEVYDDIRETCLTLRDAGYGVWVLSHFQTVKVKAKDAKIGDPPLLERQVSHADKLHLRLHPFVEYCGEVILEARTREVSRPKMANIGGVDRQVGIETKAITETYRVLTFDPSRYDKILKSRVQFPNHCIELPENHPFDALLAAYHSAVTPAPAAPTI